MGTVPSPRFKKIYLEITNVCNLQCSFCPEVERPQEVLDTDQLCNYFTKVKGWAERVCLHVMGEPTNHPQFSEFVELAEKFGVQLEITTNGVLLNSRTQEALLNPAVVQVNFSLQSFFDNFPEADPNRYLDKIFSFASVATERRPNLYINFRLWNLGSEDDTEVAGFILKRIEKQFGVKLNPNVDPAFRKSKKILGRIYLHFDTRFKWPHPEAPILSDKGRCHGAVSHLAVHANGDVVPCCLDKEAHLKLGNLRDQSLEEVLESGRFKSMINGFERGELVEDLCQRCDYIQRF